MEQRNSDLAFARMLSEREARKAQKDKLQQMLAIKKTGSDRKPVQPFTFVPSETPAAPGEMAELFGPESIQNRDVSPGDFVEIRKQGKPYYGIYMQHFDQAEGRLHSTSITQGDAVLQHRTADVVFRIPGFVFLEKFKTSVWPWDVVSNPTAPPAGVGKTAATFADESLMLMGANYTAFSKIYDTFWHERKRTTLTTPEAARFVFGKEAREGDSSGSGSAAALTLQELYATHVFLTQDVSLTRFEPSIAVRWTGEFVIRPPQEVLVTETVIDWIRRGDPRLNQFIEKAGTLVQMYRKGEMSSADWINVRFTDSDRTLIEFVRQTAFKGYSDLFSTPHLTYLPRLLRPLDAYGDIDGKTAFDFLNEIGIWPSWYNMEINRSAINLSGSLEEEHAIMERIRKLDPACLKKTFDEKKLAHIKQESAAEKAQAPVQNHSTTSKLERPRNPMVLQSPTEMYRRDPCDSIRHDFGHQPIYAIDDPSASELDDAFSIEPVPATASAPTPSTWVHVHMALLAKERVQTAYLPDRSWTMLPRALTEETMSLKNDGQPKKVLTFSCRISNDTGEILDSKIVPGIVRNVVTLNYDDVDEVLSWDRVEGGRAEGDRVRSSVMRMPEDKVVDRAYYRASKGSLRADDQEQVQELLRLQAVAQTHADARLKKGAFNFNLGRPSIELAPYPIEPVVAESGWSAPTDFSKWQEPQINCRLDPGFASPSRLMVAEYMVMAGRVAARFAQHHSLPIMYRNQPPPQEKYRAQLEELIRTKTSLQTGMLSVVDMLPLRPYISGAEISTNPLGHWSMGIQDGYCKVTSPLRRYSDMVSHWQIKGALLSSLPSSSSLPSPPPVFSLETLIPMTGLIRDRERMLGMLEARSIKFWLFEMLRRRLDAGLDNRFEGMVLNPTADGYNVLSTKLSFQTVVKADADVIKEIKVGDRVVFEVTSSVPQRPYVAAEHIARL
ncbi:hypothetical protein BGZ70_008126 [Mortierella alpina]|uniref:RNB domain-containing protein n=1 Tax=Mortierella alpina TaxID=64518 RepID=A0A9P6J4B2_MORAP|nr:hypothetical protein BGZ70_008126 [Mortierella alpina]